MSVNARVESPAKPPEPNPSQLDTLATSDDRVAPNTKVTVLLAPCTRVSNQFNRFAQIVRMNSQIHRSPHSERNILSVLYVGVSRAQKIFYRRGSKFA